MAGACACGWSFETAWEQPLPSGECCRAWGRAGHHAVSGLFVNDSDGTRDIVGEPLAEAEAEAGGRGVFLPGTPGLPHFELGGVVCLPTRSEPAPAAHAAGRESEPGLELLF